MLHCCLQTLIRVPLSSLLANIKKISSHQSGTPAAIFLHPSSCVFVHSRVAWLFGRKSSTKATSDQTSLDSRWVYQGPRSELMALLDIFRSRREVSLMKDTSAAVCFLGRPLRLRSSALPDSLFFFKRAWTTPVCIEFSAGERPCWRSITTSCLVAVLSLAMVYEFGR